MSRQSLPVRVRLALWYMLALGIILLAFSLFVYVRASAGLINQVDAALIQAAGQALLTIDERNGRLAFGEADADRDDLQRLNEDFIIYLLTEESAILDALSNEPGLPIFPPQESDFHTWQLATDAWRVYRLEVTIDDEKAQLLAAQELEEIEETLAGLRLQLLLGVPLGLLLAGLGGYFLAARALKPIDEMTRTAQAIADGDLSRRIGYNGPADEVGRLARTFDHMLDRLQAAFVRERRFTGDAAHELRTPLTALKGRVGVTLSRPRPSEEYRGTLIDMEGQIDRLIRLSNDLLFISRLDQGQFQPQMTTVGLTELLASLVDQIHPLASAHSVEIVDELPAGLTIQADVDLIIRLFLNLLDNAVKYTPTGGCVTIRGQGTAAATVVSIHNTGPGIPAEDLPHLFERFYRVDHGRSRNANGGGAGLGLAIAWEISRVHGGELTAESENGNGVTFSVRFPTTPVQQNKNHAATSPAS